jgi:cyclase
MSLKNPYKTGGMFEGASHLIFNNAKKLRKNMTEAETVLWMHIKERLTGFKFRRQHPIGIYIADFYCHKVKLIIEIDGSTHKKEEIKKADETRAKDLIDWGYTVIRFTNVQVLNNANKVLEIIKEKITQLINLQKKSTLQTAESKTPL